MAGLTVTATTFVVDSRRSAASAWTDLQANAPGAVVVFDSGSTLAPLLTARRGAGSTLPVLASSTQGAPVLPAAAVRGVQVIVPKTLVVSRRIPASLASFRARVLRTLGETRLGVPITPYAQGYDALQLFAGAANGVNAYDSGSVRTFIENANFNGLLGTYDYTSTNHEGLAAVAVHRRAARFAVQRALRRGGIRVSEHDPHRVEVIAMLSNPPAP